MKGRQERSHKVEEKIKNKIQKYPGILEEYLYYMSEKTALTKNIYIDRAIQYLDFIEYSGDVNVFKDVKPTDINRYMEHTRYNKDGKEKGESARANIYFGVSDFYNFLVMNDYVDYNVCSKVKPPKVQCEREPVSMTSAEMKKVVKNIQANGKKYWKDRDLAIFILGCSTGLRVSSIVEINLEDIDFDESKIEITEKGNKTFQCIIGETTKEYILKWLESREELMKGKEQHSALFINSRRTRLSTDGVVDIIAKWTKILGKHITPHKMRHSCATNLYKKEHDIYLVKERLHHKNIQNTMIYTHISQERQKTAANVLDSIF